jgi:alkylation response protein AidB-like acyl-CoA dehydrogenase
MPSVEEVAQQARQVAEQIIAPNADAVDREGVWPEQNFRALQAAGLAGLVLPTSVGGFGLGMLALTRVCEEIGVHCASTAISWGMHYVASAVLAAKATPEQRDRLLVPIAAGRHLTTLALSEPGSGSHFYLPETTLERRPEGGYSLSGEKSFVTNGAHADSYVLSTAAADAALPAGQFSCVVVPNSAPGMEWGPHWSGLGMRGNSSRNLMLRGVAVPQQDLLGNEGDQIWYVFTVVAPYFLSAMSGTYLGLATAALEEARAHITKRRHSHSGASLADSPIVQHRIGELWAKVARTRAFVHHATAAADSAAPDALPALCSAKAEVAECVVDVVNEVMSLLGGRGYGEHSRIERMLRDSRAAHVMAPTTDLLRTWTGRAVLGVPLLTD